MKLSGKTALITGGGSGIGASTAWTLAEAVHRVIITGRHLAKLTETAAKFTGQPPIKTHEVDVADRASVNQLFAWLAEKVGPVHILINAAGVNIKNRTMAEMQPRAVGSTSRHQRHRRLQLYGRRVTPNAPAPRRPDH